MRRLKLTRLAVARTEKPGPTEYFPGDPCPTEDCGGVIGVDKTVRTVATITRYLKCKTCGFLPENKLVESIRGG